MPRSTLTSVSMNPQIVVDPKDNGVFERNCSKFGSIMFGMYTCNIGPC